MLFPIVLFVVTLVPGMFSVLKDLKLLGGGLLGGVPGAAASALQ